MSKLLFATLLAFSANALAVDAVSTVSKVNFTISDMVGAGDHVYYSCDSLEDLTESMLKKMGASDIRVSCSGGLDHGDYWGSPSIRASFSHAVRGSGEGSRAADYREVVMKDSDNCHAAQEIFANLRPKLDLASVDGTQSFCSPRDSYKIQVQSLMFN